MAAIIECTTWDDAVAAATVRAATDNAPMGVAPMSLAGTFAVLPTDWLMADDILWDVVATIVQPDPDLAAMLADAPAAIDTYVATLAAARS